MNKIKILALVLLSAAIGAVIIQNRATVKVAVLFTNFELPLILLLSVTALAGFVLGLLVAALSKSRPSKSD
jgi:uncharacterized integral membrane protein